MVAWRQRDGGGCEGIGIGCVTAYITGALVDV